MAECIVGIDRKCVVKHIALTNVSYKEIKIL